MPSFDAVVEPNRVELRNAIDSPLFRLLRCHAGRERCAAEFEAYAER